MCQNLRAQQELGSVFGEKAQNLCPEATWIYSDIHDMPFEDNSFDWVLVNHALESQKGDKEFDKTVKELCRGSE